MRVIWFIVGIAGVFLTSDLCVCADGDVEASASSDLPQLKAAEPALLGQPTEQLDVNGETAEELNKLAVAEKLLPAEAQQDESGATGALLAADSGAAHENESQREARQFRTFGFGRPFFGGGGFGRPFFGGGFGRPYYGGGFGRPYFGGGYGRPFFGGGYGRPFFGGGFGRPFYGRPCCYG